MKKLAFYLKRGILYTLVVLTLLLPISGISIAETLDGNFNQMVPSSVPTFEKRDDIVFSASSNLIVFSTPSESAEILGTIPIGWAIDRMYTISNGFENISFESKEAFVKSEYISTENIFIDIDLNIVYNCIEDLEVFEKPDVNSEIMGTIPINWGIEKIATLNNGWTMISYDNKDAFVATQHISTQKPRVKQYLGEFVVTFYCPCYTCNGSYGAFNALSQPLTPGRSAAIDPRVIPLKSDIYIEGIGDLYTDDTGGAIKGNRIDVCLSSHAECKKRGKQTLSVYIYE